jgi:hypothetical protein
MQTLSISLSQSKIVCELYTRRVRSILLSMHVGKARDE